MEKHNAGFAGCPCKPIGGMRCNLLVASSGETRRPMPLEGSEQGDIRVPADAENLLDAAIHQELRDVVGHCRLSQAHRTWSCRHGLSESHLSGTRPSGNVVGVAGVSSVPLGRLSTLADRPTLESIPTLGRGSRHWEPVAQRDRRRRQEITEWRTRPITPEETAHVDELVARGARSAAASSRVRPRHRSIGCARPSRGRSPTRRRSPGWPRLGVEESGIGDPVSRVGKRFKVMGILRDVLRQKSVGVIEELPEKGIVKYGKPAGMIACSCPTTNPDLTPPGNRRSSRSSAATR